MGKGTDKLYITHAEWASEDAYSASAGSGVSKSRGGPHASFRRLPYNFCALSLQPFQHPTCTQNGTIFDIENIATWLKKHNTNPVDGSPLKSSDLITLHFAKNEAGEYVDPVTFKVFTDNTHIVALRNTGNVFAWDTVERLNIKPKMWRDLVSDDEFGRRDIITLQDPQNIESRDLSSFKYLKDGESVLTEEEERERANPMRNLNLDAMGSSAKVLRAKEAVAKAREERAQKEAAAQAARTAARNGQALQKTGGGSTNTSTGGKPVPYNAAKYTSGKAAASFTSTGLTPHTQADLALLSDEQYMLKRGRVKAPGYARIVTNFGEINLELRTEYAPKACYNFIQLAKKGFYNGIIFHRNIRNFMIQGGDPTGTGRGGQSFWGKNFEDEIEGPAKFDARGVLAMANKGKGTNSSQFFITYRAAMHLNNKHTIFGQVVDGQDTLAALEAVPTDSSSRPTEDITIKEVVVFVDPFEEFLKAKKAGKDPNAAKEESSTPNGVGSGVGRRGEKRVLAGNEDDDRVTWTGKRIKGPGANGSGNTDSGVGKYLKAKLAEETSAQEEDEILEFVDDEPAPSKAKGRSAGGFGNFDAW